MRWTIYKLSQLAKQSSLAAILICLGLVLPAAGTSDDGSQTIGGVIGADDRALIDNSAPPWTAVGRINIAGYRQRRQCTGTLVAPNLVLTAAHCLVEGQNHDPVDVDRVHFLAGLRRGEFLAHGRAACLRFLSGGSPPFRAHHDDAAVIVLTQEIDLPVAEVIANPEVPAMLDLVHAGYTRDRPFSLAADRSCILQSVRGNEWHTNCDTNFGASGGPLFVQSEGQLMLGAIMVGYVTGRKSIALSHRAWNKLLNQSACGQ